MPRIKPTKKLDVLGSLDLRPEQAVGDYIESCQQETFFQKPPKFDSAGDSIDLLFLHNSREHEAMLELQKEMLATAQRQTKLNESRVTSMYKTQELLRERFIQVNGFIKDCGEKKRIAEKAINDETALHKELTENIDQFKSSIEELTAFREALKSTVQEFQPYEKVLEDVVKVSDIFTTPKDCMDRCDALMLAQQEINRLEQEKIKEIEDMRLRMVQVTNEAALVVLGLKNELSEMERNYNQSRALCFKWEKVLAQCKNSIANNQMDRERTLDAINILYRLLCRRRDFDPAYHRNDIEEQMDFIKGEMELLNAILIEYDKQTATKKKAEKTRKTSGDDS